MHLILPKTLPDLEPLRSLPLFFLAGPIRGGGDWHLEMSRLLEEHVGECIIANPSRYKPDHPLYRYQLSGRQNTFPHQTDWERHYLQQAAEGWPTGCIIFWLGCEDKKNPRKKDDGAYATDTRGEIGEWRGQLMYVRDLRVVMGADPMFPGLSKIARNFEHALGPGFKIYETMKEVVDRAAYFAQERLSFAD